MTGPKDLEQEPYLLLGRVLKGHGLKGEVRIKLAFKDLAGVLPNPPGVVEARFGDGRKNALRIRSVRLQGEKVLMAFEGYPDRTAVEVLIGAELWVRRDQIAQSEEDVLRADLIGCRVVTEDGTAIGLTEDVWELPANDVLQVVDDDKEVLIPLVPHIVTNIDLDKALITIYAMEGLLD